MFKSRFRFIIIPTLLIFILSSCNMPGSTPQSSLETIPLETAVALTIEAELADTAPQDPNQDPTPATDTPQPDTAEPTDTQEATVTPSNTPLPCNQARFVKDVSIPDGKVFPPNKNFTKTWRLRNTGSCAWTSGYKIIFDGGDAMGGASEVAVTGGTVNPGEEVDVSVNLTAPGSGGTYRGNWKLKDPSDVVFGVENSTAGYFWVEIKVVEPSLTPTITNTPLFFITLVPPVITIIPFITPSSP